MCLAANKSAGAFVKRDGLTGVVSTSKLVTPPNNSCRTSDFTSNVVSQPPVTVVPAPVSILSEGLGSEQMGSHFTVLTPAPAQVSVHAQQIQQIPQKILVDGLIPLCNSPHGLSHNPTGTGYSHQASPSSISASPITQAPMCTDGNFSCRTHQTTTANGLPCAGPGSGIATTFPAGNPENETLNFSSTTGLKMHTLPSHQAGGLLGTVFMPPPTAVAVQSVAPHSCSANRDCCEPAALKPPSSGSIPTIQACEAVKGPIQPSRCMPGEGGGCDSQVVLLAEAKHQAEDWSDKAQEMVVGNDFGHVCTSTEAGSKWTDPGGIQKSTSVPIGREVQQGNPRAMTVDVPRACAVVPQTERLQTKRVAKRRALSRANVEESGVGVEECPSQNQPSGFRSSPAKEDVLAAISTIDPLNPLFWQVGGEPRFSAVCFGVEVN